LFGLEGKEGEWDAGFLFGGGCVLIVD